MTRYAALIFAAIILIVILLPSAVVSLGRRFPDFPDEDKGSAFEPPKAVKESQVIRFFRADRGEVVTIALEDYLVGVVMAEMPVAFDVEALKAQAVIARTYTLHKSSAYGGGGCNHSTLPADICSDSTHCQAWVDPVETAARWWPAAEREQYLEKVRLAVWETAGEVVVYRGSMIEAVYHSTCGGQTEVPQAIWSGGLAPYLQSFPCPYCLDSPHYRQEIKISYAQFASALQQVLALPVAGGDGSPMAVIAVTPGGRVGMLKINDTLYEGKEIRRLLGLPSTAFEWQFEADGLLFLTRGYGHGIGLCQYGAHGMADQGKSYRQIIAFYYPGTSLTQLTP